MLMSKGAKQLAQMPAGEEEGEGRGGGGLGTAAAAAGER